MGLVATYNPQNVALYISHVLSNVEGRIIAALDKAGHKFVDSAKAMTYAEGGFRDDTGDLRSSIGFYVYAGSNLVSSYFSGNPAGKAAADQAVSTIERIRGYQLIGIAGMDYAAEVESRGLNVITVQATLTLINLGSFLKAAK